MRPLELTVEGFRSYRGRATFDLRDRRLVGVVGPIGSGKSSLLDAVTFALYGKTPTYERDTRSLIHQQLDQGHVELRFSVDGHVWRAVRALRRRGQSGHQLERLTGDGPGAASLETVSGETNVTQRVTTLLGMDFKTFCRSVLLAQNRFAEFLAARPAERDQVLKGVFGLERLDRAHEIAKARLAAARAELDGIDAERERIAGARERLPGAEAEEKAAGERVARLAAVGPDVTRLEASVAAAGDAAAAADVRIAEVEALTRELPSLADIDRLSSDAEAAETEVKSAGAQADAAEELRRQAEADAAQAEERAGGAERLDAASTLIAERGQQILATEEWRTRTDAAEKKVTAAAKGVDAARAAERKAAAGAETAAAAARAAGVAAQEAEAAFDEALHGDMASELRGDLHKGKPCPVCAQPVAVLPPKSASGARAAAAEKALDRARAAHEKRRGAAESARTDLAAMRERVAGAREVLEAAGRDAKQAGTTLTAAERALRRTETELVRLLGPGDPVEELSTRRKTVTAARETVVDAEEAARATATVRDAARERADALRDELAGLAVRLSGVWGRLGESRAVERSPEALRLAFRDVGTRLLSGHEEAKAAQDAAAEAAKVAARELGALFRETGVSPEQGFAAAMTQAATTHGAAKKEVETLRDLLAGGRALANKMKKAERRRDLAERLSEDLKPSAFLRFLLEEERAELAGLGSEHFQDLTGGSYRFGDDGNFAVLDMNAGGTQRRSDSLSGGETFLASLALALALAEMVSRAGGRMDAFFLDEGFGSLDADHLDRAMEGIERLVAESERRLVVVVSHVPAMRDAIEDLIVLDKDSTTGDTVVRSGARIGVADAPGT